MGHTKPRTSTLKTPAALGLLLLLVPAAVAARQSSAVKAVASPPSYKAKTLNRPEIDALLSKPDRLLIVDVRRPDEVTAIGGFPVYLNVQFADLERYLALIPRDRIIVTVSNHAVRAGRAADLLTERGFKVAGAIGAQTYEAEGGQLTKIAPPPPRDPTK